MRFYLVLFVCFVLLLFSQCRKELISVDPTDKLEFSVDTLRFDTVFTALGSSTQLLKIKNPNRADIFIERAYLSGNSAEQFALNIDGVSGKLIEGIRVRGQDSVYVFAEVTINPNAEDLPFLLQDSLVIEYNENVDFALLEAYGQNANYIFPKTDLCDAVWTKEKPYFLIGNVFVDTLCSLTIMPGTNIHCFTGANLIVAGELQIQGSAEERVNFEGHRLEDYFNDLPGQWGNIILLRTAQPSTIQYATISEATTGIVLGSSLDTVIQNFTLANAPSLEVYQTVVRNTSSYGVFSFLSNIYLENTLVYGNGEQSLAILFGGACTIEHSSFLGYGQFQNSNGNISSQQDPVLLITDFVEDLITDEFILRDLQFEARNSIFYGNTSLSDPQNLKLAGEIQWDLQQQNSNQAEIRFKNCGIKTIRNTDTLIFENCLVNIDPEFQNVRAENYAPSLETDYINAGNSSLVLDVYGNGRFDQADLGAVESNN